jgi:ketosteroid isomerase-like protein
MPDNNRLTNTPGPGPSPNKANNGSNTPNNRAGNKNTDVSPADDSQSRAEVTEWIMGWKAASESHNLSGYMANYSERFYYYTRRNVDVGTVRADKARAFSMYDSLHVNISNLTVTVGPAGDTATAVFDKEWDFRGGSSSSGKVRSQLDLRKTNGKWLITGERDLHLYYKS